MHKSDRTISILCIFIALVGCTQITQEPAQTQSGLGIDNPASKNCIEKGGTLSIVKRGDGGEYGICTFTDNKQCEEWAMFRGDCPKGGVSIDGLNTEAARFCVITGAEYQATSEAGSENELGICSFKNGKSCDAMDYFNGDCDPNH